MWLIMMGYKFINILRSWIISNIRNLLHFLLRKRGKEMEKRNEEQIILFGGLIENSKNKKN